MKYSDAHLHSNPLKGIGAEAIAHRFKDANGWLIGLIMLPTWYYGGIASNIEEYKNKIRVHLKECEKARKTGIKIKCFAGLHPAEIDKVINMGKKISETRDYALKIINYLYKQCDEKIIDGIGEVGRQHYKVRPETLLMTEEVLEHILTMNKNHDCLLQLHLENVTGFTAKNIAQLIVKTGCKKENVLIHHANPKLAVEAVAEGLWATIPVRKEVLKSLFKNKINGNLLFETDYTDDPYSKATAPWDIPIILKELIDENVVDENVILKISVDNAEKYFRIK